MKKVLPFIFFSLLVLVSCSNRDKNGKNEKSIVNEYDFIKDDRLDVEYLCSKLFKETEYKIGEIDKTYNVKYYIYVPAEEFENSSIKSKVTPEQDERWVFFEGSEIDEESIVDEFSEKKLRTVISKDDEVVSEYWDDDINYVFFGGTELYDASSTPDNLLISDDGVAASHKMGFYEYGNYTEFLIYSSQSKEMNEDRQKYSYHSWYVTVFTKDTVYVIYFCFDPNEESQIVVKGFECKMNSELDDEGRCIHSFSVQEYENIIDLKVESVSNEQRAEKSPSQDIPVFSDKTEFCGVSMEWLCDKAFHPTTYDEDMNPIQDYPEHVKAIPFDDVMLRDDFEPGIVFAWIHTDDGEDIEIRFEKFDDELNYKFYRSYLLDKDFILIEHHIASTRMIGYAQNNKFIPLLVDNDTELVFENLENNTFRTDREISFLQDTVESCYYYWYENENIFRVSGNRFKIKTETDENGKKLYSFTEEKLDF